MAREWSEKICLTVKKKVRRHKIHPSLLRYKIIVLTLNTSQKALRYIMARDIGTSDHGCLFSLTYFWV